VPQSFWVSPAIDCIWILIRTWTITLAKVSVPEYVHARSLRSRGGRGVRPYTKRGVKLGAEGFLDFGGDGGGDGLHFGF
jgi:hypothetical protein